MMAADCSWSVCAMFIVFTFEGIGILAGIFIRRVGPLKILSEMQVRKESGYSNVF
jgi:hypothetical protein